MRFTRLFLLILVLMLAACGTAQPNAVPPTQPTATRAVPTAEPAASPTTTGGTGGLAGTRWQLVAIGTAGAPMPVLPGTGITLEFEADGQAGGSGGCNSYGGAYQVQGNMLTFSQLVSTARACEDNNITQQEQFYFNALQATGQFEVTGDHLTLWYDNRQSVLNFVASASATPIVQPTGGPVPTPGPAGGSSAIPPLTPAEPPERVELDAGSTSTQRRSLLPSGLSVKQYVLAARVGQTMTIVVTSDDVPLSVILESPTGVRLLSQGAPASAGGGDRTAQTVILPETGDYRVTLVKAEHTPSTNYEVDFTVK